MKEFNLKKALAGEPVITRDGRKVTQIHYEKYCVDSYSVCAYIGGEGWESYKKDGHAYDSCEHHLDLFMAPDKKEGWINLYKMRPTIYPGNTIFNTKSEAEEVIGSAKGDYVDTVKIEWYK